MKLLKIFHISNLDTKHKKRNKFHGLIIFLCLEFWWRHQFILMKIEYFIVS